MYKEYPPDKQLQHLVETYWVSDGMIHEPVTSLIMPDGCVDIIFDFQNGDKQGSMPQIVGTMTSALSLTHQVGKIEMLGIRFHPGGISSFMKNPVNEFTDQSFSLSVAESLFEHPFYEYLPELPTTQQRIDYINQYLISKLSYLYLPDKRILHAIYYIKQNHGIVSSNSIAQEACLCQRSLERKFKTIIGISPKQFSSVTRFQHAREYLKSRRNKDPHTILNACGYYDHSHMYKEFQQLGSISPTDIQL